MITTEQESWPDEAEEPEEAPPEGEILARFARLAATTGFFTRLGRPISREDADAARDFVSALGFPDADVQRVSNWEDAGAAAETHDFDSDSWEASESLRAALHGEAVLKFGEAASEAALREVLALVYAQVETSIQTATGGVVEVSLANAAAGAALRAVHNAALVLLAGEDEDHAFAHEYRLFQLGRWPIALTGRTLHLF